MKDEGITTKKTITELAAIPGITPARVHRVAAKVAAKDGGVGLIVTMLRAGDWAIPPPKTPKELYERVVSGEITSVLTGDGRFMLNDNPQWSIDGFTTDQRGILAADVPKAEYE